MVVTLLLREIHEGLVSLKFIIALILCLILILRGGIIIKNSLTIISSLLVSVSRNIPMIMNVTRYGKKSGKLSFYRYDVR